MNNEYRDSSERVGDLERELARVRRAGLKAQDKWEGWVTSELEGCGTMFVTAMKDAKKNRRSLERQS